MHERKTKMFERSEGFIALPGGFGTLEELIEILTWRQLGLHGFPISVLNVNGFFDHLQKFFEVMQGKELLSAENKDTAMFFKSIPELVTQMKAHKPPVGVATNKTLT